MDITDRAGARFSNASQESLKLNTPNCAPDSRNGRVHLAQSPLDGWQSGEFSSECSITASRSNGVERAAIDMSTIEEVRTAEKKVQEVLAALKKAGAQDQNHLSTDLKNATDDYARAVRELNSH